MTVSRVININLTENEDWQGYFKTHVVPIEEALKGKLGADKETMNESDNNIFDDEFRNTFGDKNANDDLERAEN